MLKLALNLTVVAIVLFIAFKYATKPAVASVDLTTVSQDNKAPVEACKAKKTCVIAYVAPWCGACHQLISHLPAIRPRLQSKDVGLLFIVGAEDDVASKQEMMTNLNPEAVMDSSTDGFRRHHKIEFFPSIFVVENGTTVVADPKKGRAKLMELVN